MELAKSGDPQAIATLINRSLASKGIHATAEIEAECLNIFLRAAQVPNQKAVVTIIHRGMMILQVEQVKRVKILTHRSDNNYLAWQHEFKLSDYPNSPPSEDLEPSHQLSNGQPQNVNLARNSSDFILVQKFSQIQQNSQAYQDIIVRFTDEQIGTVRCLTTLTELIQVISKPSFLFAAVAANPNLRSLLDTIAESSQTDEHGDQVITNLSILQPGQQWQKAKIRLVTKIFLEPNQDQEEPEQKHQGITLDLAESVAEANAAIAQVVTPEPANMTISEVIAQPEKQDAKDNVEVTKNFDAALTDNTELTIGADSITVDSLFDDFPETGTTSFQKVDGVTDADASNQKNIETSEQKTRASEDTTDALFEDFSYAVATPQVINDRTQGESGDSLFDDFLIDSTQSFAEASSSNNSMLIDPSQEDTAIADLEDDLFKSFNFEDTSINSSGVESIATEIDAIKSKIPKQSLDRLLALIEEGEQSQDSQVLSNQAPKNSPADMGTVTIERILGNMDSLTIDRKETTVASNFVTLADFSEDLESVGF
ncbi:MAG: hypothetical protein DCE90_15525 [Pseudanabaena sp.]|nr:MAG: hypothetical protein DCE90_15525 [Pseudanabaena sp.]